jgi:hypothetical protein
MMWRTMGGALKSMRRVGSTGIELNNVDVDDVLHGNVGATTSPCSTLLMMSLMARWSRDHERKLARSAQH